MTDLIVVLSTVHKPIMPVLKAFVTQSKAQDNSPHMGNCPLKSFCNPQKHKTIALECEIGYSHLGLF